MDSSTLTPHEATEIAGHLLAAKIYSLAACVMLFYDIFITFGDEVEKIWKQRYTFATVLWFLNRYLSPLGYIVIIVSFQDPGWGKSVCNRYVLYPEALKIVTSAVIGVIFILRLYSIYGGSMFVLGSVTCLLLAELAVKIWAFTDGTSVALPNGLVGCILTGKTNTGQRFVFTWVAELIFDTAIFVATLSRTFVIYRRHRHGAALPLVKIMMRDGIIYFAIIFAANVVTVTLFLVLPADLKAINASFSTLITSLMVSRLVLNLRTQALRPSATTSFVMTGPYHSADQSTAKILITSTIIGNLGEPVSNWFDDDDDDFLEEMYKGSPPEHDVFPLQETRKRSLEFPFKQPQIRVEVTQDVSSDVHTRAYIPRHSFEVHEQQSPARLGPRIFSPEFPPSSMPPAASPRHRRPSSAHSHAGGEHRGGVWIPPRAWRLDDGVQLAHLGRPRRSSSS